ncbi:MAG: hypothetical protein P8R42_05930 [Candidatus Binatia bacterium]|nr:hypothetical protein [Candidatus Binatia bacterium]
MFQLTDDLESFFSASSLHDRVPGGRQHLSEETPNAVVVFSDQDVLGGGLCGPRGGDGSRFVAESQVGRAILLGLSQRQGSEKSERQSIRDP